MIGPLSKRPIGSSPEALFHQEQWDRQFQQRQGDVPGAMVSRTTRGNFVRPIPGRGGGGISITTYRFKVKGDDYIVCRSWNGATEGSKDIFIALPFKLRDSILRETIDGRVIAYGSWDSNEQTREATDNGTPPSSETQVITPRYLVDDLIIAAPVSFTGTTYDNFDTNPLGDPVKITIQDLNMDGRAYARME